jgi:hypothetical protein
MLEAVDASYFEFNKALKVDVNEKAVEQSLIYLIDQAKKIS